MSYTKLFQSILQSSLWVEDTDTKVVWITMLALADKHGEVQASLPGLARTAGVSLESCERVVAKLSSPDKYSRTPDAEGRRIEPIDGGWSLINHAKYRAMASKDDEQAKNAERQARYRHRHGTVTHRYAPLLVTPSDGGVTPTGDIAEADSYADSNAKNPPRVSTPPVRAREDLRQEPDPNYLPPAPTRGSNPSKRKPTDLQECLAMAARIGWGASEASRWHSDMEASGWAKVDGTPFGNWSREMCIARDRAREQKEKLRLIKSNGDRSAPPESTASKILRELDAEAKGPPPPIREIRLEVIRP